MMPNINVSLQILPMISGVDNIYPVVDKVIAMIDSYGVKYEVGPMETTMEGELPLLLEIVQKAQEVCLAEGANRIVSVVKIDYAKDGVTIDEKVYQYR
jgi:uncharacterized protein YqgV (UPF0045/DUF77 family)